MRKDIPLYIFIIIVLWYAVEIASAEPVVINQPIRIYADGTVYPPNAPIVYSDGVFKLTNDIVVYVTLSRAYDQSRIYEYFSCFYPVESIIMYDFTLTSGVSIIGDGIVFDGGGYSIEVRGPALSFLSAEDNNTYLVAHGLFGIYINGTSVTVRNVKVRVYVDRKADADTSIAYSQEWAIPFDTRYGYPVHASIFAFSRQQEVPSITLENVIAEPVVITNLDELQNIAPYDLGMYRLFSIFVPAVTGFPSYVCFWSRGTWRQESEPFFSLLPSIPLAFAQPESVVTLRNVTASFLVLNATVIGISSSNLSNVFFFSSGSIFLDTSIVTGVLLVDGHLEYVWATYDLFDYSDYRAPNFSGIFRAQRTVFNTSFIHVENKNEVVFEKNTFIDSLLETYDSYEVSVKMNTFLSSAALRPYPYYDYDNSVFFTRVINITLNNFLLYSLENLTLSLFLDDVKNMQGLRNVLSFAKNFWNISSAVCALSPPSTGQSISFSNTEIPFCLIDEGNHTVTFGPDLTGFNWTWTWRGGEPDGINDIPVVLTHEETVYDPSTGSYVTFTRYYMLDPYPLYTPFTLEEGEQPGGEQPPPSQPPPAQPSFPVELPSWVFYALAVLVVLVIVVFAATRHAIADTRRFVRKRR